MAVSRLKNWVLKRTHDYPWHHTTIVRVWVAADWASKIFRKIAISHNFAEDVGIALQSKAVCWRKLNFEVLCYKSASCTTAFGCFSSCSRKMPILQWEIKKFHVTHELLNYIFVCYKKTMKTTQTLVRLYFQGTMFSLFGSVAKIRFEIFFAHTGHSTEELSANLSVSFGAYYA